MIVSLQTPCLCLFPVYDVVDSYIDAPRCWNCGGIVNGVRLLSIEKVRQAAKAIAEIVDTEWAAKVFLKQLRRAKAMEERRWSPRPPTMSVARAEQPRNRHPSMRRKRR